MHREVDVFDESALSAPPWQMHASRIPDVEPTPHPVARGPAPAGAYWLAALGASLLIWTAIIALFLRA